MLRDTRFRLGGLPIRIDGRQGRDNSEEKCSRRFLWLPTLLATVIWNRSETQVMNRNIPFITEWLEVWEKRHFVLHDGELV